MEMDSLRNGFVDLGTHCTALFASLLFVDVRTVFVEQIFTQAWYGNKGMGTIIATLGDYLDDYEPVVHPSLRDVLIEEVSDELLARYLSCITSVTSGPAAIAGIANLAKKDRIKFRRSDPFTDKIKDDVVTVFNFFGRYENSFAHIKDRWRAVNAFVDLLAADIGQPVVDAYLRFKMEYWDVQIVWVEAVLRTRDDFDRNMLAAVKAAAAQVQVERGPETVMSRVR